MAQHYSDREHEVCATCGCMVGHGCPESEPCDCDAADARGKEWTMITNSDTWPLLDVDALYVNGWLEDCKEEDAMDFNNFWRQVASGYVAACDRALKNLGCPPLARMAGGYNATCDRCNKAFSSSSDFHKHVSWGCK